MKKRLMEILFVLMVVYLIILSGCAFHNETSWGVGDCPQITTTSQRTIAGRSARD